MEPMIQASVVQETVHPSEPIIEAAAKQPYQPPCVMVYGKVAVLTRGSGGDYDDECTSGHQPGDD